MLLLLHAPRSLARPAWPGMPAGLASRLLSLLPQVAVTEAVDMVYDMAQKNMTINY